MFEFDAALSTAVAVDEKSRPAEKPAAAEKPKKLAPVVDLMAALKQSLAQMEGKKKPAATTKSEERETTPSKSRRGRG